MHKLPSHKQVAHEKRDPFLQNVHVFLGGLSRRIVPEKVIKTMLIVYDYPELGQGQQTGTNIRDIFYNIMKYLHQILNPFKMAINGDYFFLQPDSTVGAFTCRG